LRKSSVENNSLMIIEDKLSPKSHFQSQHKSNYRSSGEELRKLKAINRYKNSKSIGKHKYSSETRNISNASMETPLNRKFELDSQNLRRYAEVNASVEQHLRKYEYLIPDLRKKKFDLLKQILGERSLEDIQHKLEKIREEKALKHNALSGLDSPKLTQNEAKKNKKDKLHNYKGDAKKSDSPKYTPHSGKITENYQQFGGLGSRVGDPNWKEAYDRRKAMLMFSSQVNEKNKEVLNSSISPRDLKSTKIENIFLRSSLAKNSNVNALMERREKALEFAKSIRKPKMTIQPQNKFDDERFAEYDNNQYMLENQKIKMLFG
jgi:hypothetical protein